jgi:hypothetical protein
VEILLNDEPDFVDLPGHHTINFHLKSTYNGLLKLKDMGIKKALKIRSDMRINSLYFFDTVANLNELFQAVDNKQTCRLTILPPIFFQERTNYVPDYLMFGHIDDMIKYWKYPVQKEDLNYYLSKGCANQETFFNQRYQDELGIICNSIEQFKDILSRYFIVLDIDDFNVYWGKYGYGDLVKTWGSLEFYKAYEWLSH